MRELRKSFFSTILAFFINWLVINTHTHTHLLSLFKIYQQSKKGLFDLFKQFFQCTYINGSPQNTFVPGILELVKRQKTFISGDDFKSGQTKLKSVLVDFLVSAGIKPVSIVSYNHLGNNDGYNLSAPQQFHSKEVCSIKENMIYIVVWWCVIMSFRRDVKTDKSYFIFKCLYILKKDSKLVGQIIKIKSNKKCLAAKTEQNLSWFCSIFATNLLLYQQALC